MKKTGLRKSLSFFLCMMLIAAMALVTTGCNGNTQDQANAQTEQAVTAETAEVVESAGTQEQAKAQVIGEGATVFAFTVVDKDGNETAFEIHTDKTVVGEALLDCGLISGDPGDYGLYVKTVNGITADYDTDGAYWAFYVDGEYAQSGVDTTNIEEGKTYTFKYEKS